MKNAIDLPENTRVTGAPGSIIYSFGSHEVAPCIWHRNSFEGYVLNHIDIEIIVDTVILRRRRMQSAGQVDSEIPIIIHTILSRAV